MLSTLLKKLVGGLKHLWPILLDMLHEDGGVGGNDNEV